MAPSPPFFTEVSPSLDIEAVISEAIPLGTLVLAVGVVALVPVVARVILVERIGVLTPVGSLLTLVTQFVLAVGSGLVLMYVVARANQLSSA